MKKEEEIQREKMEEECELRKGLSEPCEKSPVEEDAAKKFVEDVIKKFPEALVEVCAEALAKGLLSLGVLACGALLIFVKGKLSSD